MKTSVVLGRREFFNITLANKKISIAVAKKIPRFMIKNSVITLVLHVSGAGTNSFASAVLNIRIGLYYNNITIKMLICLEL